MISINLLRNLAIYYIIFKIIKSIFTKKKLNENFKDPDFNEELQPLEVRQQRELNKFYVMEKYEPNWILIQRLINDKDDNDTYKFLIDNINNLSKFGFTLLTCAAEHGETKLVKDLIDIGAKSTKLNIHATTSLHKAGNKEIVLLLKESGCDPNQRDTYGNTPLITNSYRGNYETVLGLIEVGSIVNLSNNFGVTALMNSTHYDFGVTKLLLENNASIYLKDINGNTALHHAAKYGSAKAIKDLIEKGANPNEKNDNGNTPFLLAKDEYTTLLFMMNKKKWNLDLDIKNNSAVDIKKTDSYENYKNLKKSLEFQRTLIILLIIFGSVGTFLFYIKKRMDYKNVDYEKFKPEELNKLLKLDLKKLDLINPSKIK